MKTSKVLLFLCAADAFACHIELIGWVAEWLTDWMITL